MLSQYERLVEQAVATPFEGWDWSAFAGRFVEEQPSWDYRAMVRDRLRGASAVLDLGTGGGEFLKGLGELPPFTVATEGYPPNVPVARRHLAPLGVQVVDTTGLGEDQAPLPFPDGTFDLIISRHEAYQPPEMKRLLRPGGWFVTQQVGYRDVEQLNDALHAPRNASRGWDLAMATAELTRAGFTVSDGREEHVPAAFHDIGAVVLFLRVTPWQVPGFDVERYRPRLRVLHKSMSMGSPLPVTCHRFLLAAQR